MGISVSKLDVWKYYTVGVSILLFAYNDLRKHQV